jgi:hypothetical protein
VSHQRCAEWLVRSLGRSSDGQQVVDVVGVSPFLREKEARFLVEVEKAAGSFKVLQPQDTALVKDPSPRYRDSLLFLEAHLRRSVSTDNALVVGQRAAMDALPYQLEPAAKALAMPRQRLLIADPSRYTKDDSKDLSNDQRLLQLIRMSSPANAIPDAGHDQFAAGDNLTLSGSMNRQMPRQPRRSYSFCRWPEIGADRRHLS